MASTPAPTSVSGTSHEQAPERVRIPAWLPPALYAVVTLLLFRTFVFGGDMLFGSDTEGLGYMARAFFAERLAAGDFPGWNPLILGGTPFLDSLAGGDSLYPPSVLLLMLLEPYRALGWKLVLHVFLAGCFMYGWARALGRSRAAATLAGLTYLVGPFMVTLVWPGHDGKLFVTALAPALFWAVERWFAARRLAALAGTAATVALVLLTTHFQMAYFLFGAVGAYAIFRTVQIGRGGEAQGEDLPAGRPPVRAAGAFGAFLAASLVGAAAAGVQLLPAFEYITEHSRRTATTTAASSEENRAYASSWSLHPEEVVAALAVPEFVGSDVGGASWTSGTYWGRNPFKLNHEYLGLVALVLAGLAFVGGARRPLRWFFLGLGAVALLYALGTHTPVWGLFYALVPGIELFRAASMAIFLTGLSVATLMAFGVDRVLAWTAGGDPADGVRGQRVVWIVVGVLALGMLLAAAGTLFSIWNGLFYGDLTASQAEALQRARPFIARGFLAATGLVFALGGTLLLGRRGALKPSGVVAVLALLLALDAMRVDAPFITTRSFEAFAASDPNADFLVERQAQELPFRVLDMTGRGQEVRLGMFGLELAGGHHPNDLARYRDLTGMVGSGVPMNLLTSPAVAAILNVGYLVWPVRELGDLEGQGLPVAAEAEGVSATQISGGQLYEVVYRLPTLARGRLVAEAEVVPDVGAVARLMDPAFDPASRAILAEAPPRPLGGGVPEGDVTWIERTPDLQRLRVRTDRESLLIVADNWFPAWEATVSGEPRPVLRAYHTLRAVPVPAGEHEVVLRYAWGRPVRTGLGLTLAGWLAILAVAGLAWFRRARRATPS
jgi:hypothetical protein